MKAFAYIRVSRLQQELSPEAQRAQLEAYCAMKGYELVHIFEDAGVSGGVELAERPEGSWLMALAGEVDAIVFAKLDRAFRSTVDCIMTADRIIEMGKVLHFCDMGIDTSTATGELCMTMIAAMARFERRRISDRITEALGVVKAQGRKIGSAGYGERNVGGGRRESVPEQARVVAKIRELRGAKKSFREIANTLTQLHIPTSRGGAWAAQTVKNIAQRAV